MGMEMMFTAEPLSFMDMTMIKSLGIIGKPQIR